jgi:hypothetical protein
MIDISGFCSAFKVNCCILNELSVYYLNKIIYVQCRTYVMKAA